MERNNPLAPTDPSTHARALEQVHDAVLAGREAPLTPRPVVMESWRRSLAARIDPDDRQPPVVFPDDEVREVRESHPLAVSLPVLRRALLGQADETVQIMIVTDAEGNILWREGHPDVHRAADRVHLAEGTAWSESAIGTNAMGTALAVGAPTRIHSAEHLVRRYHSWTCAASPIRDPDTGGILGVVDLSGPVHTMHPALMALVSTAAQLVEAELRERTVRRDERLRARNLRHLIGLRGEPGALLSPSGRVLAAEPHDLRLPDRVELNRPEKPLLLADGRRAVLEPLPEGYLLRVPGREGGRRGRPQLELRFLGCEFPVALLDGQRLRLGLRHAEILALLALHPAGLNTEQLALQLHGERGNPVTVRAEIHRLRAQLGPGVVRTRPYRLDAEVTTDFGTARQALHSGDLHTALSIHTGELLPLSESPAIRDEREELLATLRLAVLDSADTEALWRFASTEAGRHDLEVLESLGRNLPRSDPRHAGMHARRARLLGQERPDQG